MRYSEFEDMKRKAILYDTYIASREANERFIDAIRAFKDYEKRINYRTNNIRFKKVKSAGGSPTRIIQSDELRKIFEWV